MAAVVSPLLDLPELQGAWSIGIYKGTSPFSLQPLESHEPQEQTPVAWPVANPVLTCASIGDVPSSFGESERVSQGPPAVHTHTLPL